MHLASNQGDSGGVSRPFMLALQLLPGIGVLRWTVAMAMLALVGWGIADEMRTSRLEAWLFTGIDRGMSFAAQPGASDAIRFPKRAL